jgi:hypothetical protein
MRSLVWAAAAASFVAGAAMAQDAPPPGCRWQGDGSLACKDGKGHWRRSGDDQIVGTYAVAKPKPKPKPAPAPSTSAVAAAPVAAAPIASAPALAPPAPPPLPPAPEPPVVADAGTEADLPPVPAELQAAAAAAAAAPPAAAEPAQEAPRPWWRRWLDSLWRDIQAFLRLFGLGG